ncbi:MAG: hypothetical protein R6V86_02280 [Spirochaetia bacterium]
MNSKKTPYKRENRITRILLYGTVAITLLLTGACSFTTEMADGSINPKLSVMGLQSDVTEVNVRVTGQDYQRNVTVTPSDNRLEFFLPPGDDVKFEVEAANNNVGDSPVYSWGMTRYADLVEGKETELAFTMGPKDTKILVPDKINDRIVQINSLDISEDVNSLGADQWQETNAFYDPSDTALDNQGRIWVSYNYIEATNIDMFENITVAEPSYTSGVIGTAIVFDRMNSYLYYISGSSTIGRFKVTSDISEIGTPETFDLGLESDVATISTFGIAVDSEGVLYFAGGNQLEQNTIFKYDPERNAGNRIVSMYTNSDILGYFAYMDLLVKNNHLYLTNPNGSSGNVIMKFTRDLQFVGSFGRVIDLSSETADQPGEFYGPTRFLATTTNEIYVTDDADNFSFEHLNRIIRFKDINGTNWKAYHPVDVNGDELGLYFPQPS